MPLGRAEQYFEQGEADQLTSHHVYKVEITTGSTTTQLPSPCEYWTNPSSADMKALIVLSAVVAVSLARPGYLAGGISGLATAPGVIAAAPVATAPIAYIAAIAAPLTITSQHHAQDELGQYSYGHAGGPSAKEEIRTLDGVTRGGYSYIDANGLVQSASYVSDPVNGFRVAATNLPVAPRAEDAPALDAPQPVQETPEVAAARAANEALQAEAAAAAEAAPDNPEPVAVVAAAPAAPIFLTAAGVPVETPEVAAARAANAIAHIEAKRTLLGF